jgi:glycolate oxidase FAD binding subunit
VAPATVAELAALLRDTSGTVRVRGAGTKWTWGGAGPEPDVVVDTTALDAVVEHAAGDLVVTVQAGTRLDALQARLADAGQRLALDPPQPGATVGGVVSTAASGPRRLRFGTPRDLLIGCTLVLADGTVARSGGKVVKNVAGYDLGKLVTGAFGTLAVLAECTFRLHPAPRAVRVVSVPADEPAAAAAQVRRGSAVPSALEWYDDTLHVLVESGEVAAGRQADALAAQLGGTVSDTLPAGFTDAPWRPGEVALKVTHRLGGLAAAVAALRRRVPSARLRAHAGSGVVLAALPATDAATDAATGALAEVVAALRADVAAVDGTVVVVDAPAAVKAGLDVWGPVPGLAVMRRIKEQFDPERRLAPGRFVGGI